MRVRSASLVVALSLAAALVEAANPFDCASEVRTRVVDIYPSAARLPANVLRFYVYFSEPMAPDLAPGTIGLHDADGRPIPGVFLPTRYALWSPDGRRLTLIFDPGRVKSGLFARETLGPQLQVGHAYTLTVQQSARDANGCELAEAARKAFTVTANDHDAPAPADWELSVPPAATRVPLSVALNGPHDHASLAYGIRVHNSDGAVVAGAIELDHDEQTWRFTPARIWTEDVYQLVVSAEIEDVAGNRPREVFDRPSATPKLPIAPIERPFKPLVTND